MYSGSRFDRDNSNSGGDQGQSNNKLYIGNLPFSVDNNSLSAFFENALGPDSVSNVQVIIDKNRRSKGFGFVTFATPELAEKATELRGQEIEGLDGTRRQIDIAPAHQKRTSSFGGGGFGGGGFGGPRRDGGGGFGGPRRDGGGGFGGGQRRDGGGGGGFGPRRDGGGGFGGGQRRDGGGGGGFGGGGGQRKRPSSNGGGYESSAPASAPGDKWQ